MAPRAPEVGSRNAIERQMAKTRVDKVWIELFMKTLLSIRKK
jgi:hypothetical protein